MLIKGPLGDFTYVATYVKGKVKKVTVDDYRLLVLTCNNLEEILFLTGFDFNPTWSPKHVTQIFSTDLKRISPTHIKNKVYNYYEYSKDISTVEEFFQSWKDSNPLIHLGNCVSAELSSIKNYKGTWKFNSHVF